MRKRSSVKESFGALPRSPQKPSERVIDYLLAEFDRPDRATGSRLPTVRQLAGHLNVSVPTVHGVIRKLAKQGRVRTEKGSGTFLVRGSGRTAERLTVAVGMPDPGGALDNPWHHGIYAGMLQAALASPIPIQFLPGMKESILDMDVSKTLLAQRMQADGLILFPFNRLPNLFEEVRSAYESEGKPVVTMHPPVTTASVNFVSPDFARSCHEACIAWKQTGRRNLMLLLHAPLEVSTSSQLRLSGFANALGTDLCDRITCRVVFGKGGRGGVEEDAYLAVTETLEKSFHPDAIFASGDSVALGALRALKEAGLRVPEEVSVIGNSGLDASDSPYPRLTRTRYQLAGIGENLVRMLAQRIELRESANNCMAGVYYPGTFIGGATTRTEENAILGIAPQPNP